MFEHFPHTADLGLRVQAPDLPTLFVEAARGLTAMVVPDLTSIKLAESRSFEVPGKENDLLLFDWLNELLFVIDTEHIVFAEFTVTLTPEGLTAEARGEQLHAGHRTEHEVKAITYHGLTLRQSPAGWMAEVIVDI